MQRLRAEQGDDAQLGVGAREDAAALVGVVQEVALDQPEVRLPAPRRWTFSTEPELGMVVTVLRRA